MTSAARTIYENPSYGRYTQWVCVTHRFWTYADGYYYASGQVMPSGWKLTTSARKCGWISAASTSIADQGSSYVLYGSTEKVSVDVVVTWQLSSGYLLGKKIYDYDSLADYACSIPCDSGYRDGIAWVGL